MEYHQFSDSSRTPATLWNFLGSPSSLLGVTARVFRIGESESLSLRGASATLRIRNTWRRHVEELDSNRFQVE